MRQVERFKRAIDYPRLFARGLNRVYHRRGGLRSDYSRGIHVFEEDWDTLLVLDACRYDMFERVNHLQGALSAKESRGSATTEWLRANIDGRDLSDTVYISANPQLERNREDWNVTFHEITNIWLDKGWDSETGTVLAETMNEAAIRGHERFPDKRIVVHYMQPHYPFVSSTIDQVDDHLSSIQGHNDTATGENVWNQKFTGTLDVADEKLWEVYSANLEYVLNHVEDLLSHISGKTVITSDHGNYVGERAFPIPIREYGHPRGLYDEPVIRVPWLEISNGLRRDVVAESSDDINVDVEEETVENRLKDLGYVE